MSIRPAGPERPVHGELVRAANFDKLEQAAAALKAKMAKLAGAAAAPGSGAAGVGSGRGGGQSGNRPHGGANDVGLGPASNGVVGSPFAHDGKKLVDAADDGDLKEVKRLLAKGVDIEHVDDQDWTALLAAAFMGHTAVVQLLLGKGADVHHANSIGATPLYLAAQEGREAVVLLLLDAGADINQAANEGSTPTAMAAQQGHLASVRLLVNRGADINQADSEGATPLYMAARQGHKATVRLLLDCGAIMGQYGKGGTPLHAAAGLGHPRVIELLLRRGADPKVKDLKYNETALDWAKDAKHPLCTAALQPRTIACLRPWSAKTAAAYPLPFRLAIAVLLRQVSHQTPPAIAPDPAREAPFNLGRTRGVPMCPVTDAARGETRDVDLLQELILTNGLIDCDWFSIDPKKRLRRWLLPPRRLALRQWQTGDTVLVQGLVSKPELNGRVVVVQGYLRKKRRFACQLKDKGRVALRQGNLEAPRCGSCGSCGATLRCGASCQKAGWRAHKAACKAGSGGGGVGSGRGGANDVGLG